ncbi:hypothetical protein C8F01DRAFT_1134102 [Mycena amicta]|nr:hypothetical protein C8F01DRAFT_1134102 [Mycena amicta]
MAPNGQAFRVRVRVRKALSTVGSGVFLAISIVICAPVLLCAICCGSGFYCGTRNRPALPGPEPLPTQRIDISLSLRRAAKQQQSALLSRLPLELRRCIYEQALGGRQIRLQILDDWPNQRRFVRAKCYYYSDVRTELEGNGNTNTETADRPTVALLRACRQIYLEAQPILLAQNTFCFVEYDLQTILPASLGLFALPQLRSLCVEFPGFPHDMSYLLGYPPQLLSEMHMPALQRLTFRFHDNDSYSPEVHTATQDPRILLDTPWGGLVRKLTTLEEVRMVFMFRGVQVDVEDKRWKELERLCLSKRETPAS